MGLEVNLANLASGAGASGQYGNLTISYPGNQLLFKDTRNANGATGLVTYNQDGNFYYDANTNASATTGGHIWRTAGTQTMGLGSTGAFTSQGPQYFNTPYYLSVNQGMLLNFYTFAVYGGNSYMHFKTNLRNTTSQMYVIEARGYDYGNGCSIAGNWCGYMYAPNGTSNPISNSVTNWGNQAFCSNQYLSSDGYLVLVGTMASYYCSCTFNSYATAQGIMDMRFTATSQTASSTGAF